MAQGGSDKDFDRSKAELFDALGHPIRIRLLEALKDGPLTFSELKRRSGIESSGHLTFHLDRLDGLVEVTSDGNYALTGLGKEALTLTSRIAPRMPESRGNKVGIDKRLLAALVIALFVLAILAGPTIQSSVNQAYPRRYIVVGFSLNAQIDPVTGKFFNETTSYDLQNYAVLKSLTRMTITSNDTVLYNESMPGAPNWKEAGSATSPLTGYYIDRFSYYNISVTLDFSDGSHYASSRSVDYNDGVDSKANGVGNTMNFFFDVY